MSTKMAIKLASSALSNLSESVFGRRWQNFDHVWNEWAMAEKNIRRSLVSDRPSQEDIENLRLIEQQCRRVRRGLASRMHNLHEDDVSLVALQSRLDSASKLILVQDH